MIAVLFVFLGDVACSVIVALVIRLALLFAISVLYFRGMSANLLSIGAVDFGIIVDSSVIIVETVYRKVTAADADPTASLIDRISDATRGVERPILYSTIIIVCAFIPLFTMDGSRRSAVRPHGATYAFSILGALLTAVTLARCCARFSFATKWPSMKPASTGS